MAAVQPILATLSGSDAHFLTKGRAQTAQVAQSLIAQNKSSKGGIALFRTHEHPRDTATATAYTTHNHERLKAWARYLVDRNRDLTEAENVMTLFMAVHAFGILKRAEPYVDSKTLQEYGFDFETCLSSFLTNADHMTWYHLFYVLSTDKGRPRLKHFLAHHGFGENIQTSVVGML